MLDQVLTHEVRQNLGALLVHGPHLGTGHSETGCLLQERILVSNTVVVLMLSVEEALLVVAAVAGHRTAKAFASRRHDGSIDQIQLVHVVSIDHRQCVLGLDSMVGWVLHQRLVGSLLDVVSVVEHQIFGVLLRLAVIRTERCGNSLGRQRADRVLVGSQLYAGLTQSVTYDSQIGLCLVELRGDKTVFVPVFFKKIGGRRGDTYG